MKIANIVQIVNIIAPLLTRGDDLLVQSIFHPFEMMAKRRVAAGCGRGSFLHGKDQWPGALRRRERHPRRRRAAAPVSIEPTGVSVASLESGEILTGPGPKAENSWESCDVVVARPFDGVSIRVGRARLKLPPLSVAALTLKVE